MAQDLGVIGPVVEIQETDLLLLIEKRLEAAEKSGELETLKMKLMESARKSIERPSPVSGVVKTTKARRFSIDTSATAPYDMRDQKGQIFHRKGTVVSPLDMIRLQQVLLFIDADDPIQLQWAFDVEKKLNTEAVCVLIKGSPNALMQELKRTFYFDQNGALVKRFKITQVPAIVYQEGRQLIAEELVPEDPLPETVLNIKGLRPREALQKNAVTPGVVDAN